MPSLTSTDPASNANLLIVPGVGGSGVDHWQSWLQRQLPGSQRLEGVDWHAPILADWALQLRQQVRQNRQPVWLVAHSFGCLVSAVVVADVPQKIAGVLLVAPADPERFFVLGRRTDNPAQPSIASLLPQQPLAVPGLLISSDNDPWMSAREARHWAGRWQLALRSAGAAGHINTESGHGPWPLGLQLLAQWRRLPCANPPRMPRPRTAGRGGALARVRLETRRQLGLC